MRFSLLIIISFLFPAVLVAQDPIPKVKTKKERKAELKNMTLKEKIEDALPVEVTLPSARVSVPGQTDISTFEEAQKYLKETVPNYAKDVRKNARRAARDLKRRKAVVFDGKKYRDIPVKKVVYKQKGSSSSRRYIEFYVLKDHQQPLRYRRVNTWYDHRFKRISEVLSRDPKTNSLLHGPYKEYRGNNLIKEGSYYLGVKDGRWLEYDRDFTLINKENYEKGFYKESIISYYDADSSRLKEVMPIQFGVKNGKYYKFYESGTLQEEGEYDNGRKVKIWIEYYDGGNQRKVVTQYPNNFYEEGEPYVLIKYDKDRKVIYEHKKDS